MFFQLDPDDISFPNPSLADSDGLLAIGGDLRIERLLLAYELGIFPWYGEDTPILWYSPHERFVLYPDELRLSKTMRKLMREATYVLTYDRTFAEVIEACAYIKRQGQDGTWITDDMMDAYKLLHRNGHAHSVEVWNKEGNLVGGLYGVSCGIAGQVFCGESMFSLESNTSKLALVALCQSGNYSLIDCQIESSHLSSMGARLITRKEYMRFFRTIDVDSDLNAD
ncbi:leucyl/phenylalanyl-tRNA--protein transferase [Olivibacter sitiensis]|uniref:leucyl/phenylalanyl-tRNA--protein transferase n=1 Tax=Olivibacter sitiensis TaxID=376470 RepID=UPI000412A31E|nr:leucyl/phenylalanyl-tRNA--protein transferase [Olivibacter sitiensis]